jgi:2-(1,2-epoxy-1,2-dihydrophenyl)acetyl-CoA isomerase
MTAVKTYEEVVTEGRASDRRMVELERPSPDRAVLRLADPAKLNILSAPLMLQLQEHGERLVQDPDVRSIVLTGDGPGFSAGGDLRMMQQAIDQFGADEDTEGAFMPYQWIRYRFGAFARLIAKSDRAWIAALNGPAAGVGLAFALTCDLAIAAEDAVIVPAFGKLGLVPEVGTSWALTHALGYRRAFEFYVGGEHIDARRAAELGLVNEVVPSGDLLARANEWCDRIAGLPDHVLPIAKPLLRASVDASWDQSLTMEELAEPMCFTTRGFADGVASITAATAGPARH